MTSRDLKGRTRDSNTLRAQYLENSWRCYLATIANSLLWGYPSDSLASCVLYESTYVPFQAVMSDFWAPASVIIEADLISSGTPCDVHVINNVSSTLAPIYSVYCDLFICFSVYGADVADWRRHKLFNYRQCCVFRRHGSFHARSPSYLRPRRHPQQLSDGRTHR